MVEKPDRKFPWKLVVFALIAAGSTTFMGQACSQFAVGTLTPLNSTSSSSSGSSTDPMTGLPAYTVPAVPQVNCTAPGMRGAEKASVRRLNKAELVNTIRTLTPWYSAELNTQLDAYSDLVDMTEVSSFSQMYSLEQMQQLAVIADNIAYTVSSNANGTNARYAVGGDCFTQDPITDACWTNFFTTYGKKVYRHPLSTDEVTYLKSTVAGLATTDAVYRAMAVLMRSPDLLFHIETGVSEEASRVRLSDYEVANRIAYAITAMPPDAELLAAADNGLLKSLTSIETQVRRLLKTSAAKTNATQFFSEWLQYSHFAVPDYAITSLATGITWGQYELVNDVNDYLNDVFWNRPGTFQDLMTRTTVFPRSDSMKIAYATSGRDPAGLTPYDSPDHPGLATRLGFLSEQGAVSSPIKRGVFIKRRLLCDVMPTPDFSIVAQRLDQLGSLSLFNLSNAEMTTTRTSASACVGCHSQINPIGFALEAYDVFGKSRTVEAAIDWSAPYGDPKVPYYDNVTYEDATLTAARKGQMLRGALHPLPYPVSNVVLAPGTSMTVTQPSDLTNALGTSARAQACMSTFFLRHMDRRVENTGDNCTINEAVAALQSGAPVSDVFVRMLATEDIFWRGK